MGDNLPSRLILIVGIVFSAVVLAAAWFAIVIERGKRELADAMQQFDADEGCPDRCDEWLTPAGDR